MNLFRTGVILSTLCSLAGCTNGIDEDLRATAMKGQVENVDALIDKGVDVKSKFGGWKWEGRLNYSSHSNIDWHCRFNVEAWDHAECD